MKRQVLVLGGTGMLGRPVVRCLAEDGHRVRVLARDAKRAHRIFGSTVDIVEGSALREDDVVTAMKGCDSVHISLTQDAEHAAMRYVIDSASAGGVGRISYVSATTAREENRWFEMVDVKLRTEQILVSSGIPRVVFCPTWVMETLANFIRGDRAVIITGRHPPKLHFFAARDFGRMVAASYADDRAVGKRLFVHGPEGIALPDALRRFYRACRPQLRVMSLKLWQAKWIAKLTGRKELTDVTKLIDYFDRVGELGDPQEADALFGAPPTTLDEWFTMPEDPVRGAPH